MRHQRQLSQPAHQHRGGGEQANLGHQGQTDRPAEAENLPQALAVALPQALEQGLFGQGALDVDHQEDQREDMHQERGQRRAANAHLREAPGAEDQRVVGDGVDHDRNQHDAQHHVCPLQRCEVAFQHHRAQGGEDAPGQDVQILARQGRKGGRLAEGQEDGLRRQQDRQDDHPGERRQPERHPRQAPRLGGVALALGGGNQRRKRRGKPAAGQEQHGEQGHGQRFGGQGGGIVPAQHGRIDQRQRHLRQLAARQGQAQDQDRPQVPAICHRSAHPSPLGRPYAHGKAACPGDRDHARRRQRRRRPEQERGAPKDAPVSMPSAPAEGCRGGWQTRRRAGERRAPAGSRA